MNTGLGLNFLRIVNEEGTNGWSQIYARVPFDDVELRSKGALFGAVYGKEVENWADLEVEMMTWIDEYFNGISLGGELSDFFEEWKNKYSNLSGVWLWARLSEKNIREIKMVKWGESGVYLKRGGNNLDLMGSVEAGRVIKGTVKDGEVLYMWTDGLGEKLLAEKDNPEEEKKVLVLGKMLLDESLAASGLILRIEKMAENEEFAEEVPVIVPMEKPRGYSPVTEELPLESSPIDYGVNEESVELVGNRYVGPIGIKEKIANWWVSLRRSEQRELKIGQDVPKRKKMAGFLGMAFLVLLLISLVTGSIKMKNDAEDKKWRNFYEPIEKSRQEALSLAALNPIGARKLMEEVKTTFDLKKVEFLTGKYKTEVVTLEKKIGDSWIITSGEKASEIEDVAKIDLVRPGFIGDKMAMTKNGKLLVVDSAMGVVVSTEVSTKDIRVIAGKGEAEGWIDVTGEDKKTLIMNKIGVKNVEKGQQVLTFDAAVVNPISIGRFMENIYILDGTNKEIFKYAAVGENYGDRSRWLKQGQSMGFIPVDMAIDADIWVVAESGQVEKFRRGAKEQFTVGGLPEGIKVKRMAIEVDGSRIALLDVNAGMVVICNKDNGNCPQQLKSERLKMAKDVEFGGDGSLYVLFPGVIGKLK